MFSGIVEEVGRIREISKARRELSILAGTVLQGMKAGDSISVNGVCLTVTRLDGDSFTCGLLPETLERTNLAYLARGSAVNLERTIEFGKRVGGHFVTGHVDGMGKVLEVQDGDEGAHLTVRVPASFTHLVSALGSISVDGVSLTVFTVDGDRIRLSLTPFTLSTTIARNYRTGSFVNIEADILARYAERSLIKAKSEGLTFELLKELGYS